ncbi:hypothetical protein NFI96_000609 [Prochilodus magdalenae]|nr:hypothetical protein NFI96_000609 [Prochilodus magdalenae]
MSKQSKIHVFSDSKMQLRSQGPEANSSQDGESSTICEQPNLAQDISNIYAALQQISGDMSSLAEVKRSTASIEGKLSSLITRISEVEKRVEFLEGTERELRENAIANPPATKSELDTLREKIEDMENRSRRNNVRIVGIPEGHEAGNMIQFLDEVIPKVLNIESAGTRPEIERAHRALAPRLAPGGRPRAILVRFLRSGDRDYILRTARTRERKELQWEGNRVLFFPDFSRATQQKREQFKECKKALHERSVPFAMMYPATLRIQTKEGPKRFDSPKEAMKFIANMDS